ncbi:unnamed protein product [Chondrus crispus]|uniref:Uncharacterized protein n=1 Tax=Chondrus crispus TaxID=2769 RepID=R7Q9R1_CHOCR|nr:unnamed protein product [Chondrus crispus]CDF35277.1 unnamed protein product [Chondrus crispus]|eukprot:XP_005715096.1 unnamed protein product [Chondrus crispus]
MPGFESTRTLQSAFVHCSHSDIWTNLNTLPSILSQLWQSSARVLISRYRPATTENR